MAKPRKQTYTLDMYLEKIKDMDIRSDADVQRLAGQWKSEQVNELIYTVLTQDYIPPIILGEESNSQLWIIDGLQRSTSLNDFRYGNKKITPAIENPVVTYMAKCKDDSGNILLDENGNIVWEEVEFNIKNKTYDMLPAELKKIFNEYQIETVIHEECSMTRISKLIKRYNNHTSMNAAQKAFTNIGNFAREIRNILDTDFFARMDVFSEKDRVKGNLERVVLETIMCTNHLDAWKSAASNVAKYLNDNADENEFLKLHDNVRVLGRIIADDVKDLFTIKDSFVWLTFFNEFVSLGYEENKFIEFLRAFKGGLRTKEVNGNLFDVVDQTGSTKDKLVISTKLHILRTLLYEFLGINEKDLESVDVLEFIKENVSENTTSEDVELYDDILEDLTLSVDNDTKLLDEHNKPSMLGIVGYACEKEHDKALDSWFIDFFKRERMYKMNQRENYLHMRGDFDKYVAMAAAM